MPLRIFTGTSTDRPSRRAEATGDRVTDFPIVSNVPLTFVKGDFVL